MTHRGESDYSLKLKRKKNNSAQVLGEGSVYLFHHPTKIKHGEKIVDNYFADNYSEFCAELPEDAIICFLLDSLAACELISQIQGELKYRLWIAVGREHALKKVGKLPDNHAALVVFTKHKKSFKHAKVRIAYTSCPVCGKTTKDYGGKAHTYNPYGTLISDVWRVAKCIEDEIPNVILKRLCDLFALEPYKQLYYFDCRNSKRPYHIKASPSKTHSGQSLNHIAKSRLVNNDCIKALKALPKNSIDFAFADPPYNINKKYDGWNDEIEIEEYFTWCDNWIKEIYRVLKPGKTFALINIPLWIVRHYMFAKTLFDFQDLIVWEGLGLPVRNIMPAHYGIICFSKGKADKISNYETKHDSKNPLGTTRSIKEWYCARQGCVKKRSEASDREALTNLWWGIHRLKHNSRRADHPCQLPPSLMQRLIFTFTQEGQVVLDPFNGAGTTSLVAKMMNRKYIGIELSEKYHKITVGRHEEITKNQDPFRKQVRDLTAKNSRVQRVRKQKYDVDKKTLQLEVRDIATALGRKPTKEDVRKKTKFPFEYFENYFMDWGEVCAAVGDKGMNENCYLQTDKQSVD